MKCKRKTDNRSRNKKDLEALRIRVVRQVHEGVSPEYLAKALDINPRTIYRWIERYQHGGEEALRNKPKPGRPPKLTPAQMDWIAGTVRNKDPRELGFPIALWTLRMIRELIRRKFGVRLSEVSVGRVMRTLGFTPQQPLQRVYQQNPGLVATWREGEYPEIRKRAREANALIFFADESEVRSNYPSWRIRGKTEHTGKRKRGWRRFSSHMLWAVSPRGEFRFMVHEGALTSDVFCDFLKRLVVGVKENIFVIVDRHGIHRGKKVQRMLDEMEKKITLVFLPPHSPNPTQKI